MAAEAASDVMEQESAGASRTAPKHALVTVTKSEVALRHGPNCVLARVVDQLMITISTSLLAHDMQSDIVLRTQ
ncbi:hypothetical protein SBBP2_1320009 [Burkholderiales bacterium]|nr:hypothetical protein SBBP2_1320009 [Burkholderiales bacterium]